MIKISKDANLIRLFPETIKNQCLCLKSRCNVCGEGFGAGVALECQYCEAPRRRCTNRKMDNEETCRVHASGRRYSPYTRLAATIADSSLEEFIEKDTRDLTQEFALARLALSGSLEKGQLSSADLMILVKDFFNIAALRKKIEEGDTLNLKWNDEVVNSMQKRWRLIINELGRVLRVHLSPAVLKEDASVENIHKAILSDLKDSVKLLGNKVTVSDLGKAAFRQEKKD